MKNVISLTRIQNYMLLLLMEKVSQSIFLWIACDRSPSVKVAIYKTI